jgi:hypothetical protein
VRSLVSLNIKPWTTGRLEDLVRADQSDIAVYARLAAPRAAQGEKFALPRGASL